MKVTLENLVNIIDVCHNPCGKHRVDVFPEPQICFLRCNFSSLLWDVLAVALYTWHTCTVTQWSVTAVFLRCKHGLVAVQQTGQLTAAAALLHSSLSKSATCGVMMIIKSPVPLTEQRVSSWRSQRLRLSSWRRRRRAVGLISSSMRRYVTSQNRSLLSFHRPVSSQVRDAGRILLDCVDLLTIMSLSDLRSAPVCAFIAQCLFHVFHFFNDVVVTEAERSLHSWD